MSFVVATGIECSAPTIYGGLRRDELRLTGHWDRVEQDLDLVVAMGISHLRYGVPFHVVAADPIASTGPGPTARWRPSASGRSSRSST